MTPLIHALGYGSTTPSPSPDLAHNWHPDVFRKFIGHISFRNIKTVTLSMKQRRKVAIFTLLPKYAILAAIKDGSVLLFNTNKSLKTHINTCTPIDLWCSLSLFFHRTQGSQLPISFLNQTFCSTNKAIVSLSGFQSTQIAF